MEYDGNIHLNDPNWSIVKKYRIVDDKGKIKYTFLAKCKKCGFEKEVSNSGIYKGYIFCPNCSEQSEIGKIYGHYKVLGFVKWEGDSQKRYKVQCTKCGAIYEKRISNVKQSSPDSKCINCDRIGGNTGYNRLYSQYKTGAKKRNIDFNLSKDEFYNLVTKNCVYCGQEPTERTTDLTTNQNTTFDSGTFRDVNKAVTDYGKVDTKTYNDVTDTETYDQDTHNKTFAGRQDQLTYNTTDTENLNTTDTQRYNDITDQRDTDGTHTTTYDSTLQKTLNLKDQDLEMVIRQGNIGVTKSSELLLDTLALYDNELMDFVHYVVNDCINIEVLSEKRGMSLVKVELLTGRTHQIRAHMAYIGHPLVGDGKYGTNKQNENVPLKYQALCSYRLEFAFDTDGGILEYLNGKAFEIDDIGFRDILKI